MRGAVAPRCRSVSPNERRGRRFLAPDGAASGIGPRATDFHGPTLTATAFDALCQAEAQRVVGRDGVIRYLGRELQLERAVRRRVPDGTRVVVQEAANGVVRVMHRTGAGDRTCARNEAPPRPDALRAKLPRRTADEVAEARRPTANHPWRKTLHGWYLQTVAQSQQTTREHF